MSEQIVKVPNIGDFADVAVIEILVKVGDTIAIDQSLLTVESDKASMEIPSSHAGVVKSIGVKLGDKIKEGSTVMVLEVLEQTAAAQPAAAPAAPQTTNAAAATVTGTDADDCDLLVLGGGPGGYSAGFRAGGWGMGGVLGGG